MASIQQPESLAFSALAAQFPVTELFCRIPGERFVTTRVDTLDLPKILAVTKRWRAAWAKECQTYYVKGSHAGYGKRSKTVFLHRIITDAPVGTTVDHLDHDGLNNCRSNLAVVSQHINSLNRREARGRSGHRGVYARPKGKFRASVMVKYKRVLLGDHFTNPKKASEAVEQFLKQLREGKQ